MEIFIEGDYTTYREVKACISAIAEINRNNLKKELLIEARQKINEIDIQLIAYFMLFKDSDPDLIIYLSLPYNTNPGDSVAWKVRTYGTHAYMMMEKEVFRFTVAGTTILFDFKDSKRFPTNFFKLSENFMLLVFIKRENSQLFQSLFENRDNLEDFAEQHILADNMRWNIDNEMQFKSLLERLESSANPKNPLSCVHQLGRIAFYQIIYHTGVLSIYLDPQRVNEKGFRRNNLEVGSLKGLIEGNPPRFVNHPYLYYEYLEPIITELEKCSILELFIMSTLIGSNVFPSLGKTAVNNAAVEMFKRLWGFTKELAYGFKELAKNIREHSTTHSGVIAGKIYRDEFFWKLLKIDESSNLAYLTYMEHVKEFFDKPVKSFLDIHVFDMGESGVIPQLLTSTVSAANKCRGGSILESLFLEDVKLLKSGKLKFSSILKPDRNLILNQQSKRSIAHYGLMMFNNLIIKSKGLLAASSYNVKGGREYVLSPFDSIEAPLMPEVGTNYHLIIPVHPEVEFEAKLPHHEITVPETSPIDIKGVEELFNFEHVQQPVTILAENAVESEKKYIVSILLPKKPIGDRDGEQLLWDFVAEQVLFAEHKYPNQVEIFNLDFDTANHGGSIMLRLLATWSAEFPKKSLVVTNIETKLFQEVIELNEDFIEHNHINFESGSELIYWNTKSAIVFYHYTWIKESRFYFADSIFGRNKNQHLQLNKLISRTNFNYIQLFDEPYKRPSSKKSKINPFNHAFHNGNVLLPLDILLTGYKSMTLFELNSSVLLRNVIKPKNSAIYGS